ncbi:hypothetical protein B7463_g12207, partial [Scytalidium lignicola]
MDPTGSKLSFEDMAMRAPIATLTILRPFLLLDPLARSPQAAVHWARKFLSADEWSMVAGLPDRLSRDEAKSSGGENPADETTLATVHKVQTRNIDDDRQTPDSDDASTAPTVCTALLTHGERKRQRSESADDETSDDQHSRRLLFSRFGIKKGRRGSTHRSLQRSLRKSPDDDTDGSFGYEREAESSENTDHSDDGDDKSACDLDLIASLPEAETEDEQRIKDRISAVNQDLPILTSIVKSTVSKSVASTTAGIVKYKVASHMIYKARAIGSSLAIENWTAISENWRVNGTYTSHAYPGTVIAIPEHICKQSEAIQGFYRVFQAVNQSNVDTLLQAILHRRLLADLYKHYRNATSDLSSCLPFSGNGKRGVTAAAQMKLLLFRTLYPEYLSIDSPADNPSSRSTWNKFSHNINHGHRWNEMEIRLGLVIAL